MARLRCRIAALSRRPGWLCLVVSIAWGAAGCRRADDAPRTAQPTAPPTVATPKPAEPAAAAPLRVNTARGAYRVEFTTRPAPIPLNAPFEVAARVLDSQSGAVAEQVVLSVDAAMPEHGHGMNTQPVVSGPEQGTYTARGMLFHMPGRWELYFDVQKGGTTERATYVVELD